MCTNEWIPPLLSAGHTPIAHPPQFLRVDGCVAPLTVALGMCLHSSDTSIGEHRFSSKQTLTMLGFLYSMDKSTTNKQTNKRTNNLLLNDGADKQRWASPTSLEAKINKEIHLVKNKNSAETITNITLERENNNPPPSLLVGSMHMNLAPVKHVPTREDDQHV